MTGQQNVGFVQGLQNFKFPISFFVEYNTSFGSILIPIVTLVQEAGMTELDSLYFIKQKKVTLFHNHLKISNLE